MLVMVSSMTNDTAADAEQKYVVYLPEGGLLFLRYMEPLGLGGLRVGREADPGPEADPKNGGIRTKVPSNKKESPHLLKHSFEPHLKKKGVDRKIVQEVGSHADIKTTKILSGL
jgi:hypothetical protein